MSTADDAIFLRIAVSRNHYAPDAVSYKFSSADIDSLNKSRRFLCDMPENTSIEIPAAGDATFFQSRTAHFLTDAAPDDWEIYAGETRLKLAFRVFSDKIILTGRCEYVDDDQFESALMPEIVATVFSKQVREAEIDPGISVLAMAVPAPEQAIEVI